MNRGHQYVPRFSVVNYLMAQDDLTDLVLQLARNSSSCVFSLLFSIQTNPQNKERASRQRQRGRFAAMLYVQAWSSEWTELEWNRFFGCSPPNYPRVSSSERKPRGVSHYAICTTPRSENVLYVMLLRCCWSWKEIEMDALQVKVKWGIRGIKAGKRRERAKL